MAKNDRDVRQDYEFSKSLRNVHQMMARRLLYLIKAGEQTNGNSVILFRTSGEGEEHQMDFCQILIQAGVVIVV